MSKIGFIGVGNMGGPMARNLLKSQEHVTAFDVSPAALKPVGEAGAKIAQTALEAVTDADVVITMLPAGGHVRSVYLPEESIMTAARKDALLIDCSTIDIDAARAVHAAAEKAKFDFLDAPVSGGVGGAEAGTLTFMVGCDEALFAALQQRRSPMARTVVHAGGPGAGQAAKICNNMVLGVSMIAVGEAFALAEKLGLAPEKFFEIASASSGQCWSLTSYCPWPGLVPTAPSNRGYEGGFLTSLMLKDLKLAQEAAARAGAATPLGAQAEATYALFERLGFGGKDFSAVMELMRGRLEALSRS